MENQEIWKRQGGWLKDVDQTSILYDCVAVHLAYSTRFLRMQRMGVRVRNDGFTVADAKAPELNSALEWKDLKGLEDLLVKRLTREAAMR